MNHDELRQAHVPSTALKTFCGGCGHAWPCPTIRLLDENAALRAALGKIVTENNCSDCSAWGIADDALGKALGDVS
jgi:hypothetical protein